MASGWVALESEHLRLSVTSEIQAHDPIAASEPGHPLKPALRIAHGRVQQQLRVRLSPGVDEVVDLVGQLQAVSADE